MNVSSIIDAIHHASHWQYKSEGELNLVLSYRGDCDLLQGKVLRITKRPIVDKGHPASPSSMPKYLSDPILAHFLDGASAHDCGVSFLRQVAIPLLGENSSFVSLPQRVHLDRSFLEALRTKIDPLRPQKRRDATVIDVKDQDAFLMDDLSILYRPSRIGVELQEKSKLLGVELKPKWGFLPNSPFIPMGHVKRIVCRYCMQQTLKLKKGQVHHKSQYCPLDLYSSSDSRRIKALRSLLAHPQNNLKIFLDGSVIYTGSLGGQSEADRLSTEQLGFAIAEVLHDSNPDVLECFVQLISTALAQSGVLATLQQLQAKGDEWDIEGIITLHKALLTLEHRHQGAVEKDAVLPLAASDEACFGGAVTVGDALLRIRSFLQAATFKDCSLLISFAPTQKGDVAHYPTMSLHGREFEYRVNVIDLDPKPSRNIPYYHSLDSEIVSQYLLANPSPQACTPP